jgi:hypothetical protein
MIIGKLHYYLNYWLDQYAYAANVANVASSDLQHFHRKKKLYKVDTVRTVRRTRHNLLTECNEGRLVPHEPFNISLVITL